MSKITVIISPPGNNVVFYQVQYQVNLTTILNNQYTRINTFSTKLAVIGCFTCQIYGTPFHFLTRISCNVDQTLCHLAPQNPTAEVQVQSDCCSTVYSILKVHTAFHRQTESWLSVALTVNLSRLCWITCKYGIQCFDRVAQWLAVSECLSIKVSGRIVATFNPFSSRWTVGIPSQAGKNYWEIPHLHL